MGLESLWVGEHMEIGKSGTPGKGMEALIPFPHILPYAPLSLAVLELLNSFTIT